MDPPTGNVENLRGWMTIPHIARIYRVPEEVLFEALGLPAGRTYRNRSLFKLNQELFPDQPRIVLDKIRSAILSYYSTHPEMPTHPGKPLMPTLPLLPEKGPAETPPQAPEPTGLVWKLADQGDSEEWHKEYIGKRSV